MSFRPQQRIYRTWVLDGGRWAGYRARPGDIVIATSPKCGTTWMQRIVGLLIFQDDAPIALPLSSPWVDRRFMEEPEVLHARLEAQTHRRFLKTHLPLDGIPFHDEVSYIHVARDGRDAASSYHNHLLNLSPALLAEFNRNGLEDPDLGRPVPRPPEDFRAFFRWWLTTEAIPGEGECAPVLSMFKLVQSYWEARKAPNVLLVHYADLQTDLEGEMRRIAQFLRIEVPEATWPRLVKAAGFDEMKKAGSKLMPQMHKGMIGGTDSFFFKGTNGRWRDQLGPEELALYQSKIAQRLTPACAAWLERGRHGCSDPQSMPD